MKTLTSFFQLSLCISFFLISLSSLAQNWPQQNGNPGLTSFSDALINLPIEEVNRISTTSIVTNYSYADGVIYAWTTDTVGILCAVDVKSGTEKWCRNAASVSRFPSSIPAVQDSIVVAGGQLGTGIEALHTQTGNTLWSRDIGGLRHVSPVVDGERVYVQGDSIYCLDLRSGVTVWNIEQKGSRCTPAFDQKYVYFTGFDSLYATEKFTGTLVWKQPAPGSLFPSLAVLDSMVFLGSNGQFDMRNSEDGDLIWSTTIPNRSANLALNAIAITPEVMVVKTTDVHVDSIFLSALEVSTGDQLWDQYVGSKVFNCPTVVGNLVFESDQAGKLLVLDLQTGAFLDSVATSFGLRGQPIYADSMIWIGVGKNLVAIGEALASSIQEFGTSAVDLHVYPNPIVDQATITIETDLEQEISLDILTLDGKKVVQLLDSFYISRRHQMGWHQRGLPKGVYFLRLEAGKATKIRKIVIE